MSEMLIQTQLATRSQLGLEILTPQHTHTKDSNDNSDVWSHCDSGSFVTQQ